MMTIEKRLEKIRQEITKAFKNDIVSVMIYGSAAVNDLQDDQGEVNVLVVLQTVGLDEIDRLKKLVKPLAKIKVSTPLLMTMDHINTSTDVFPIEFLEIKEKHTVLQGEDIFAGLAIDTRNLRHECEHELKGRLIRLRQSYMEIGDNVKALKDIITAGHQANFPAFRTALRLKGQEPPVKKEEVIKMLAETFGLNKEIFLKVKFLQQGELKLAFPTLKTLLNDYLIEVGKIAAVVDRL